MSVQAAWVALGAALLALAVWLPPAPGELAARPVGVPRPRAPGGSRVGPVAGEAALVGAVIVVVTLVLPVRPLLLGAAASAAVVTLRLRAWRRVDEASAARQQSVVDACEALVGELRAGQPLAQALAGAARVWPDLSPVAVRARLGGAVPEALRDVARRPGAGALRRVAGAWELCAVNGSGLVHALDLVLETVRADQEARRRVRTELAATRATARMVSALPLVLLTGAEGAGADPWHVLLGTLPGQGCLLVGVSLVGAGLLWIERIARAAVDDR